MRLAEQKQPHPDNTKNQDNKPVIVGGYFLWLILPDGIQATDVAQLALVEENLIVAQGEMFEVPGAGAASEGEDSSRSDHVKNSRYSRNLRLCLAWEDMDLLDEGIVRLKCVVERLSLKLRNGETVTTTTTTTTTRTKVDLNMMEAFS